MKRVVEFAVGLVFGLGLILSGMTDPGKVLGFLDLAGAWDPSLGFVMGGAIGVACVAFAVARKRSTAFLGGVIERTERRSIDSPLLTGSLVFGVGWGLAGFCPGPALVAAGAGHWQAVLFTLAMLGGMAVHELMSQPGRNQAVLE